MGARDLKGWSALRWMVLQRDQFTCQYCGQHAPNVLLEVDHVVPLAEGGTDDPANLKTACWACNRGKNSLWVHINGAARQLKMNAGRITQGENPRPSYPQRIVELLKRTGRPMSSAEIGESLKIPIEGVRPALSRATKRGFLVHVGWGLWAHKPR